MHARNWKAPFDEVTRAKVWHQQAIAEAHEAFKQACDEAERQRKDACTQASATWELVKSFPDHPEYEATREAFERAKAAPYFTAARHALADAIRKASEAYHDEVTRLGREHGVMLR